MISVILPVKNNAETIAGALLSILHQSIEELEIIVIDDHSNDNTVNIINEIDKSYRKITVYKNENGTGIASGLNLGLNKAKFEFVARMDADDEALPKRLEQQLNYLQANKNVAVVGGQVLLMGQTTKQDCVLNYETDPTKINSLLLNYSVLNHPSVMYRKSAVLKVGGYREFFKNAEDYDLWLRLLSANYEIANLSQPLLRYNLSLGGATISKRWVQYIYHRMAQHAHYYPEDKLNEALYKEIEQRYHYLYDHYTVSTYALTLDWLLKARQYKKAWALLKLIPKKWSYYSIAKIVTAVFNGIFRLKYCPYVKKFYTPYKNVSDTRN